MSEERRGPSREEWNFPQVQCIYVGLAGPFNKEMMLRRFDVYQAELSFSNLFTSWPLFPFSCSLFLSFCPHTQDVRGCVSWKWRQQQFVRAILKPRQNSHSSDDTAHSFPWSEPRTIVGKAESKTFPLFFPRVMVFRLEKSKINTFHSCWTKSISTNKHVT